VFGDVKILRSVEVDSATVAEEVLPRLHKWLEAAVADKNMQIDRIVIKSIKLESRTAKVPPFDADLQLSQEGSIQKAVLSTADGKLNLELVPHDNQIDIAMNAAKGWVPPLGPQIEFTDLTLKAVAAHNQIRIEKFEALANIDEILKVADGRRFIGNTPSHHLCLLRGDRATMRSIVGRLGGDEPDEQRRWQLLISDLVDALVARAIDASALSFPEVHVFWGPYTQSECREIAAALAALGYRFDGLGGFADGRVPAQRDLSLALGFAGEDPMRVRFWPTEAEMPALFRDVRVEAGRYLAQAAGGLTMGEMVDLLGRRAEPLAELWNAWGRVRPLLLDAS
jgi:hypothetical protein